MLLLIRAPGQALETQHNLEIDQSHGSLSSQLLILQVKGDDLSFSPFLLSSANY